MAWTPGSFPKLSVLGRAGEACLADLCATWREVEYAPGQLIFSEDDSDADAYFQLSGSARSAVFTQNGKEVTFSPIEPGDCFGEFAAIDQSPRSASVVALTRMKAGRITGEALLEVMARRPELSLAMLRLTIAKLRVLSERVAEYTSLRADQRVMAEILRMAQASRGGGDAARIGGAPTQSELAKMVFTNRETVAREMARLQRLGLIERKGAAIMVASVDALEAEMAGRSQ